MDVRGLIQRAIGESGSLLAATAEPVMTLAEAEAHGLALAEKLGVKSPARMRTLPADHRR
jgi:carboxylesterase type B